MLTTALIIAAGINLGLMLAPAWALYDELRAWGWSLNRDVTDSFAAMGFLLGNAGLFGWAAASL